MLCFVLHLVSKMFGQSPWPRRFLAGFASICGVDVRVEGKLANTHSLLVANHTSWLDIMVLASATDCAFVSKAELSGHPVM